LEKLLEIARKNLTPFNFKALLEFEDELNRSALFKAISLSNDDAVRILIAFGANVNFVQNRPPAIKKKMVKRFFKICTEFQRIKINRLKLFL